MAFCAISEDNIEKLTALIFHKVRKDPQILKNFKEFSKNIMSDLAGRNVSVDKALAMVSYIPQILSQFNSEREDRKVLRDAGISIDAIYDVEDQFEDYSKLAKYLEIKNEIQPIVVVNEKQIDTEKKLADHISKTSIEMRENARVINGKMYEIRVTSIAKVGFEDKYDDEDNTKSPALKHGNTVDIIAKLIFDDNRSDLVPTDFDIAPEAFDSLVSKLRKVKQDLESEGYIFKTAVTVYNKLGISGEIDLVAISPEGEVLIIDFKTASQRFNEPYLKNDRLTIASKEVSMLSKWQQYGTQGYIYGLLTNEQVGIPVLKKTRIIGINIVYGAGIPIEEAKITNVGDISIHDIPHQEARPEFRGKSIQEIYDTYKRLEGTSLGTVDEIKPIKKSRQKKNFDNIGPHQPLDRLRSIQDIAATDIELEKEMNWFLSNPIGKDTLLRIDDVVNSGLLGRFTLDGITLYKNASEGTLYHEGWHRFSQVFMSKNQKDDLYESVQKDAISFKSRDGRKLNTSTAPFIDIEEFLADEFAKYALSPDSYKYPKAKKPQGLAGLFQRIWDFLKRFFGSNPRPIDVFQKLYRGKIGEYVPSVNNAYWGNLNSLAQNERGEEIVPNERLPVYIDAFTYLIGKELRDAGKSFTALKQSKVLQSKVFKNVFAILRDMYQNDESLTDQQFSEIESILENDYYFMKTYLNWTPYESLKGLRVEEEVFILSTDELGAIDEIRDAYDDVEDDEGEEEADSKPERFDRTGNEDSVMSITDDAIQDYFRTFPKIKSSEFNPDGSIKSIEYELSELNIPTNHKYYDIFYKTKKFLSGAFDMADMLARMEDRNNHRVFPELSLVNESFKKVLNNPQEKNAYRLIQNVQFVQAFYHSMTMPEVPNIQLTLNFLPLTRKYVTSKPTMVSYRTASRNLSLKIIKNWEKNFKDRREKTYVSYYGLEEQKPSFLKTPLYFTEDGKILLNPFINYKSVFPNNLKGIQDFYNMMGVVLDPKLYQDPDAVSEIRGYKATIERTFEIYGKAKEVEFLQDAHSLMVSKGADTSTLKSLEAYIQALEDYELDEMAKIYFIKNPISSFNDAQQYQVLSYQSGGAPVTITQSTDPLRFIFENIASLEEKFGPRVSSGAFRIEDKTKFPYYIPNQMLISTALLNSIRSYGDFSDQYYLQHLDPTKNKWMRRSYFFKILFDQNGNRRNDSRGKPIQIIVEDIASVRIMEDEDFSLKITEKHPRSLNRDEKFFMDVLTMFRAGAIEIPRAETSSTVFTLRLSEYGSKDKILPISLAELAGKGLPETFHSIVRDYFAGEIEKRQWYMENEPDSKFARTFNIFEGILPKELKDTVAENLDKSPEEIFLQGSVAADFRAAVEKYFLDVATQLRPKFEDHRTGLPQEYKDMIKDITQSKNIQSLFPITKAFVLNHFILSQEFYNIFFGDLYYYKNPFKRGKFVTNTGTAYFIDKWRNDMLNSIQEETLHSIYTGTAAGGKDFRRLKTGVINDVEMKSAYVDEDDKKNRLLQDIIKMRVHSGALLSGSEEYLKFVEETRQDLKKYNLINIADGQGIIGMDFYRNFSIITNIWSESKEKEYKRQKAIFRLRFDLYFKNVDGVKTKLDGTELTEARGRDRDLAQKDPFDYFNPLKISYTGPQAVEGPLRPVFDKFSVRPIIPEMAIGRRDENLLLQMVKGDIDYLKFQSGSKIHQENTFNWFNEISKGVYDLNDFTTEEIEPNELYAAYLKHQLSTEGIKEENILGSQFRKIVFGIKYSPLVRDNKNLVDKFSKLETDFRETIEQLISVGETDLFSLLGIEENNGEYRVRDMKRFLELLKNESLKRGIAINNVDYIQYDEITKNSKYPIDYAFNRQQIQDLLAGLIDDKLRRLKINGAPLIQVSSAGLENMFKNPTQRDLEKYGTTGLHYYHVKYDSEGNPTRTSTMGVKVALTKSFKGLLNLPAPASLGTSDIRNVDQIATNEEPRYTAGKIGTKDPIESLRRLNLALRDEVWKAEHMDKFILIGYRIPTQNNNFIDIMEIMEFLPPSAGAIIVPPIELIVKSGSDFDIDKMNILVPSYTQGGRLVSTPKESLEEIENQISSLTYSERDMQALRKEFNSITKAANVEIGELESIQRKIRYTILDLSMKTGVDDRIIDKIMENISNEDDVVIPEESIPEEQAFSDEETMDYEMDLFRATLDFVQMDRRIQFLKRSLELTNEQMYKEVDMRWFQKKRDYKSALSNKLIDILTETMSHPYYFEMLVTPSSASMFENATNRLVASQQNMTEDGYQLALQANEGKLYDAIKTPEQNSRYLSSLEAFDNLLSKRKDLGGWAISRTFADIFNFAKLSIAETYSPNDKNWSKRILVPLIAPSDRSKVIQNGRVLMHGDSVTGIPIKNSFDELISLTVDLASSPAYPKMDINIYNKKHAQYLINQKADPVSVLWFLNQPILKDLYSHIEEKRKRVQGYTLKHAIVDLALRYRVLDNPPARENSTKLKYDVMESKWIEYDEETAEIEGVRGERIYTKRANPFLPKPYFDLHKNLEDADYFSFENLDQAIRLNQKNTPLQKKILSYFASLVDETDYFMMLQFANNVDTNKYSTLTAIIRNRKNKEKVRGSNLFDEYQLNLIEKKSMIAPFDYTSKAYKIHKILFPKLYTNESIRVFTNLVQDVWGVKNSQIERISKIVENDYIEYIYKNFGTYKGKNISDYFEPMLINTDSAQDHQFFSYRLLEFKNQFPELNDIPFVAGLTEDVYYPPFKEIPNSYKGLDNKEIHNIFFLRNPDNPTFEKNIFTNNWRNLINFDPEKLGLARIYTTEEIAKISDFFHELVYFSLYQSGLTNTGNGFSDLIPYEYWGPFIQKAFDDMEVQTKRLAAYERELLRVFEIRFKQMNPKMNWRTKYVLLDSFEEDGRQKRSELKFYRNYYRGKDYKVTDDDLGFVRYSVLYDDDELADDITKLPTQEKASQTVPFEIGRYVEYNGEIYIITKPLSKKSVWQIYNPLKQGVGAKLGVHERNLTPRKEKGTIVEYAGKQYLVTSKEEIIDLEVNRKMNWPRNNINRINVLQQAKIQNPPEGSIGDVGSDAC